MKRLFLLLLPLGLLAGFCLGLIASTRFGIPEPRGRVPAQASGAVPPPAADEYLKKVLDQRGLRSATFKSIAQPIVGSTGTTVYLYRVDAVDSAGKMREAFVGVTLYGGKAVNSLSVSNTEPDLGGMIEVQ